MPNPQRLKIVLDCMPYYYSPLIQHLLQHSYSALPAALEGLPAADSVGHARGRDARDSGAPVGDAADRAYKRVDKRSACEKVNRQERDNLVVRAGAASASYLVVEDNCRRL